MISLLRSEPIRFGKYVVIRRNKRARRMSLRLDPQARMFILTLPPRVSLHAAQQFCEKHKAWIREEIAALAPPIYFKHGAEIPLFGKKVRIEIHLDLTLRSTSITLKGNRLIVETNMIDPGMRIKRFLKELAKERITELAYEKAKILGKRIRAVYVRDTKTRWGSCSSDRNISFSWRLIFAPYASYDYVIAHEVAHLKHLDHSARFWDACESLCENYHKGKNWMRANSQDLMRYGA